MSTEPEQLTLDLTPEIHGVRSPLQTTGDILVDGSSLEEISEMFSAVMENNSEAVASLGEQAKQAFTDDHRKQAEAYDVAAQKQICVDMIEVAASELKKLIAVAHAHLAHEWNKAVILENTEQQTIIQAADGPYWHSEATENFRAGLLALRRAIVTDTRF